MVAQIVQTLTNFALVIHRAGKGERGMIDMLVLRCNARDWRDFNVAAMEIPLECSIDRNGEKHSLRHPWEKIPSSFAEMAFKVFDFTESTAKEPEVFIEIKASPAKIMQGHNVFGADDLLPCAMALITLLSESYPLLFANLDMSSWEVVQVDVTYHSWAESERVANQFLEALSRVSKGQTRPRQGYAGQTVYFGKKNSRIKKIKVYAKFQEIMAYLQKHKNSKSNPAQYYPMQLLEWCKGMIRWEASLKKRWFERREISNKLIDLVKVFDAETYWKEAMKDIFEALEGEKMRIVSDDEVRKALHSKFGKVTKKGNISTAAADAAYRTYRAIKTEGWCEVKASMSARTFYLHVSMIQESGLSRAMLQNMNGEGLKGEVIPMVRYAVVEFRNQFPEWARAA